MQSKARLRVASRLDHAAGVRSAQDARARCWWVRCPSCALAGRTRLPRLGIQRCCFLTVRTPLDVIETL